MGFRAGQDATKVVPLARATAMPSGPHPQQVELELGEVAPASFR
jgi:hypothetical protein